MELTNANPTQVLTKTKVSQFTSSHNPSMKISFKPAHFQAVKQHTVQSSNLIGADQSTLQPSNGTKSSTSIQAEAIRQKRGSKTNKELTF
jgi:hypothetical protein